MIVRDWLSSAESRLKLAGVNSYRLDARVILEHSSLKDRAWLLAHPEAALPVGVRKKADETLAQRCERQPLAYIIGVKEFYGLEFKVSPSVLIPRPETEVMVETALKLAAQNAKVLEIGTGSGCVAIAVKVNRSDLKVTASDISVSALEMAKSNAHTHNANVDFIESDMFDSIKGRFDLILANLPYVPNGARRQPELSYEPEQALYAGQDGLDHYRRFFNEFSEYLLPTCQAIIEAGSTQRKELSHLAEAAGRKLQSVSEYVAIIK